MYISPELPHPSQGSALQRTLSEIGAVATDQGHEKLADAVAAVDADVG